MKFGKIDHYKVTRELGRGGWGVVYQVIDEETREILALKLMTRSDEQFKFRFRREIRAASRLKHPNIVEVMKHGHFGDREYFTMEYVEGLELGAYWKIKKFGDEIAGGIDVLKQVCTAIAFIHNQGVIHRDIKPSNIMITHDGVAKLMDFGLAKDVNQSTMLTQTGEALGTIFYMSPEQILGRKVDKGTDLYSLGVLFYELFTGTRPFTAEEPVQVALKHLRETPTSPRTINPKIPPGIDRLLLKLLEKDSSNRHGSAEEIFAVFEAYQAGALSGEVTPVEAAAPVAPPAADSLYQPRFVGRDAEFGVLKNRIDRSLQGFGSLVLIGGESGVGKTRLVNEAASYARGRDVAFFSSGCKEFGTIPYQTINDIFSDLTAHLLESDLPRLKEPIREFGQVLGRFFPSIRKFDFGVEPIERPPGSPAQEKANLFHGVAQFLGALISERAFIIFVDDLQWADEFDIDMLMHIATNLFDDQNRKARLTLTGTYRSDEIDSKHPLIARMRSVRRTHFFTKIDLARLTEENVVEIVQSMLGMQNAPKGLAKRIFQESEGNPFFIEEIIYSLIEESQIERIGSSWRVRGEKEMQLSIMSAGFDRILLPQSIADVVQRRLDRLDGEEMKVLEMASVIGAEFEFDLLLEMTRLNEDDLLDLVDMLIKARIITENRKVQGYFFDFYHSKFREVIYNGVQERRRIRYHNRVGQAIEKLYAKNLDPFTDALAYQYHEAQNLYKAKEYVWKSGEKARDHFNYRKAYNLFSKARSVIKRLLDISEEDCDKALRLELNKGIAESYIQQGAILESAGELEDAEEAFAEAYEIWNKLDDLEGMARYHFHIGNVFGRRFIFDKALFHLNKALGYYVDSGNEERQLKAHTNIGTTLMNARKFDSALKHYSKALDLNKNLGDKNREFILLNNLGILMISQERYGDALDYFKQCLALVYVITERYLEANLHCSLGYVHQMLGQYDEALEHLDASLKITEKIGFKEVQAANLSNIGSIYYERGEYEKALDYHNKAIPIRMRIGNVAYTAEEHRKAGLDLAYLNRHDEAVRHIDRTIVMTREKKIPQFLIPALLTMAEVLAHKGDPEDGRDFFQRAEKEFSQLNDLTKSKVLKHLRQLSCDFERVARLVAS